MVVAKALGSLNDTASDLAAVGNKESDVMFVIFALLEGSFELADNAKHNLIGTTANRRQTHISMTRLMRVSIM